MINHIIKKAHTKEKRAPKEAIPPQTKVGIYIKAT